MYGYRAACWCFWCVAAFTQPVFVFCDLTHMLLPAYRQRTNLVVVATYRLPGTDFLRCWRACMSGIDYVPAAVYIPLQECVASPTDCRFFGVFFCFAVLL